MSATGRCSDTPGAPVGAVRPYSGYSAARANSDVPITNAAWETRPSGSTIGSCDTRAPNTSTYQASAAWPSATVRRGTARWSGGVTVAGVETVYPDPAVRRAYSAADTCS